MSLAKFCRGTQTLLRDKWYDLLSVDQLLCHVSGAQEKNAYENRLAAHLQDMICDVSEWRSMVEVHLVWPKC